MTKPSTLIEKINTLKKDRNAVILTHFYQKLNMYRIADFIGDSLQLSQQAAQTKAEKIIFCGVYFMAETAKILSPTKKVYLPDMNSGCLMADMIEVEDLLELKAKHPNAVVVCYVNSSAAVKAESHICCTSANAVKVVQSIKEKEIIFVPDKGLGGYVAQFVPDKTIICYDGFCPTHWRITKKHIEYTKSKYPQAKVLVHPECSQEVIDIADYTGSTSGMLKYAQQSNARIFIVGSEVGILLHMKQIMPDKKFLLPTPLAVCENMKRNTLEQVYECLVNEVNEINVDTEIANRAYNTIYRMLEIS
jgi:quinolinate synthase